MALALPIPFTWRALFKVRLLVAAEAAVLALIRDASIGIQTATVVAAVAAFVALEGEDRLRAWHRYLFQATLLASSVIWLSFIGYAVVHAVNRESRQRQLGEFYVAAESLVARANFLVSNAPNDQQSQEYKEFKNEIAQLDADARKWQTQTAAWLLENLGAVARARFLDVSGIQMHCWTYDCEQPHSTTMNRLVNEMKNLAAIRETSIYMN